MRRGPINAIAPGALLHVQDQLTGVKLLVDTGAAFSVLPHNSGSAPTGPALRGPNGVNIPCWGEFKTVLVLNGKHFPWVFLRAAVDFAILGVDFLSHFNLLVDAAAGRLLDTRGLSVPCLRGLPTMATLRAAPPLPSVAAANSPRSSTGESTVTSGGDLAAPPPHPPTSLEEILCRYRSVLNAEGRLPPSTHGVEHHIVTSGRPVTAKFRRLDDSKLAAAKAEFAAMEKEGIVRRSSSCWSSPLHMVAKGDGTWRPCGDYRLLNLATEADCYPLPNMTDLSSRVVGCTVFSKLDLKKGYLQIPVRTEDIPKTALTTPFGLFEFLRMPFGLKNAGMTFQRFMDQVLNGLPACSAYLDDILVASTNHKQHLMDLQAVFSRLHQHGLVLNKAKCEFAKATVDFLGHKLTSDGVAPLQSNVRALMDFPQPSTVKELQGLLGLVNFYRRFISSAARVLLPLTNA